MKLWSPKEDDFYITFLECATKIMGSGDGTLDYADLYQHVHSINNDVSEEAFKRIFLQSVVSIQQLRRPLNVDDIASGTPVVLTIEAYFQLLEQQELKEA